jgi:anti-sigma regulatory factor (Ser/Thr protein kinase)
MTPSAPSALRLRPELAELERLNGYVEVFAEEQELGPKDIYALTLAAEELFANTIKHSHPPATMAELLLVREANTIAVTYVDDGPAFDPTQRATPDTTLSAEERPIGGLGIHFIRTGMDDFRYVRRDGCNVTSFRRRLPN